MLSVVEESAIAGNSLSLDLEYILDQTRHLWDELRGNRVFITGGTGFFGCWLLESFAWANHRLGLGASVGVLTRNPAAFARKVPDLVRDPAIRLHEGDVRSFDFPAGDFALRHPCCGRRESTIGGRRSDFDQGNHRRWYPAHSGIRSSMRNGKVAHNQFGGNLR